MGSIGITKSKGILMSIRANAYQECVYYYREGLPVTINCSEPSQDYRDNRFVPKDYAQNYTPRVRTEFNFKFKILRFRLCIRAGYCRI